MSEDTRNPWVDLPTQPPYVLDSDRDAISRFNAKADDRVALKLELMPEPFFGRRDAVLVLLGLNPGFSDGDRGLHGDPAFIARCRLNLAHADSDHPFPYLAPELANSPGGRWWRSKLKHLVRAATDEQTLARRVLCVEYFPYHSRAYKPMPGALESQRYGFELVRAAIRREAIIVVLRSRSLWLRAVPELATCRHVFSLRNPRNVVVSETNCPDGFAKIIETLAR